jgi:hypothetical protein
MRWFVKGLGAMVLIALLVSALLVGAAMIFGTPLEHAVVQFDDADFTMGELSAGHWLLAFAGIAVACIVVVVVVPLAILVPLAFSAIAVGASFAIVVAVMAVLCSPLILLGWLLWRLLRKAPPPPTAPPALAP